MRMLAKLALQRRHVFGAVLLCGLAMAVDFSRAVDLATFLLARQDRWLLVGQAIALIVIGERLGARSHPLNFVRGGLLATAALILIVCYLGHYWVLCGYDLSRDEQMAVFDSRIFAAGLRAQPLPVFWQQHTGALNALFMLPVEHPIAWVSAYLPVNALLRTTVGMIADPSLTGPLLTAGGLIALHQSARLLWPEDREAALVACLLYVTSGQILFAGMTAFAMPAHLTFDLVWLWLFLLRRWPADLGALAIGFAATGLHQPLFHPLFVLPFLMLLLRERAWVRLVFYCGGYALICLFWLAWPDWVHALVAGPNSITASTGVSYWSRLKLMLADPGPRWTDMVANLLRFAAWQNMLLVPLMIAGAMAMRRNRMAATFLATFLLPIAVMLLIMPFQGNGFGYRYIHGVVGSGILLAVYGWRHMRAREENIRPLLVRSVAMTLVLIFPLQIWMAHASYSAFASVEARVATSGADYFAVGGEDTSFSGDLVINKPDLSNRPIRLYAEALRGPFIANICRPQPQIALPTTRFFRPIDAYFGAQPDPGADRRIEQLKPTLEAAGCKVVILNDLPKPRSARTIGR